MEVIVRQIFGEPVPTVPIPCDRDRAEPVGIPLLRLPPPTDAPPVTATDLDALGAAAEFQFGDSAARYSGSTTKSRLADPYRCGADAAGSVITAESSPCEVLVGGGARWATIVAAAGASAEPWPEGADAAGTVLAAESSPCKALVG